MSCEVDRTFGGSIKLLKPSPTMIIRLDLSAQSYAMAIKTEVYAYGEPRTPQAPAAVADGSRATRSRPAPSILSPSQALVEFTHD